MAPNELGPHGGPNNAWRMGLIRRLLIAAALALLTSSTLFNGDIFPAGLGGNAYAATNSPESMSECITKALDLLKLKGPPSLDDIKQSTQNCYSLLYEQGLLDDFAVRNRSYDQQYISNAILLWMVVCITVSGVILAGLQLFASYRLAVLSRIAVKEETELTLARNQIALKSSVTGLSVMLLSFAFFLIFVLYVYKIDDISSRNVQRTSRPVLPVGGTIDSPAPGGQNAPVGR